MFPTLYIDFCLLEFPLFDGTEPVSMVGYHSHDTVYLLGIGEMILPT